MTETLTYIAIYLLIGWLMVEGAVASKEEDELLAGVLSMYPKPTPWNRFIGKLYLLQYIVGWPYYLFRNLILILIDLYNSRQPPPTRSETEGEGEIVPKDPFIREKFTREHTAARKLAEEYFARYPKNRYQTEVESWRNLQSANIEFTMKRLREPIGAEGQGPLRAGGRRTHKGLFDSA
jgi:hypothetical protein